MTNTNKITRAILQLIGDFSPYGYFFKYDNDKEVPVLLNKDETTTYPEIRVSPFIDRYDLDFQRFLEKNYSQYRHWQGGLFQIDIYARSIIEAHNIYDALVDRIYDFFNLETLIYSWNHQFEEIEMNTYKNIAYAIPEDDNEKLFKDIYSIKIGDTKFKKVFAYEDLELDSFYVDKDALYVCTEKNLKKIQIKVLLQGRLFQNGDAYSDRGLHYHELSDQRNLSALEDNDVERISFDLMVIFSYKREREQLPKVNRIRYRQHRR